MSQEVAAFKLVLVGDGGTGKVSCEGEIEEQSGDAPAKWWGRLWRGCEGDFGWVYTPIEAHSSQGD